MKNMKKWEFIFPLLMILVSILLIATKSHGESSEDNQYEVSTQSTEENITSSKKETSVVELYIQEDNLQDEEETKTYSKDDVALLAHIINAEQGIEYDNEEKTNKLQIYTGQVVLNRMNQEYRGASTIEEVLYSPGQYACISDCSWDNPVSERAYKNAELLLSGAPYWEIYNIPQMPDDVIFQAEFTQGSGTWLQVGDTYFCYK